MRIDQLLVQRGQAASRSQAQRLIAAGVAWRLPEPAGNPWRTVRKSGDDVPDCAELDLTDDSESRYVSRGGLKLEGALATTGVSAQGKLCLDVGQSTGGFTDCLLHAGAAHVVGVDVGQQQLHPRIRQHPRVSALEGINARELTLAQLQDALAVGVQPAGVDFVKNEADYSIPSIHSGAFYLNNPESDKNIADYSIGSCHSGQFYLKNDDRFALVVGDLSFISLTLVLPALVPLLAADGDLLCLVKPQFELQPQDIGKGGLVRDPASHARVEQRLRTACADLGLRVLAWLDSPIAGGDGNREFFVHARRA